MPMATMADAHREWHWNTGIPMGTPGCPQDACHPIEDWSDEDDFVDEEPPLTPEEEEMAPA